VRHLHFAERQPENRRAADFAFADLSDSAALAEALAKRCEFAADDEVEAAIRRFDR